MARNEKLLFEAEPDDPDRCQADGSGGEGQCRYLSLKALVQRQLVDSLPYSDDEVVNSKNCPKHGGYSAANAIQRRKLNDYRLQVWQERVNEFAESEQVNNLRGEIGVLRLLIESILNQCDSSMDLLMYAHKISQLVIQVERCVKTCATLETKYGMFLDRNKSLAFAEEVVQMISIHVHDPVVIDKLSNGFIDAMSRATEKETNLLEAEQIA